MFNSRKSISFWFRLASWLIKRIVFESICVVSKTFVINIKIVTKGERGSFLFNSPARIIKINTKGKEFSFLIASKCSSSCRDSSFPFFPLTALPQWTHRSQRKSFRERRWDVEKRVCVYTRFSTFSSEKFICENITADYYLCFVLISNWQTSRDVREETQFSTISEIDFLPTFMAFAFEREILGIVRQAQANCETLKIH